MKRLLPLLLTIAVGACRPKSFSTLAGITLTPPAGKRGVSIVIDRSQVVFASPGDVVEVVTLSQTTRPDGSNAPRSEILASRAEVLRVDRDWGDDIGLISLALTPEEAQSAALAIDAEDALFLNKLSDAARLEPHSAPASPILTPGQRGVAILVSPDQQTFVAAGDRIDVIATRMVGKPAGKMELTATTVFQNILVLGTRKAEENEEQSAVQLMLTPEQTRQMARFVGGQDCLILAVRPPVDKITRAIEPAKMSRRAGAAPEHSSRKS